MTPPGWKRKLPPGGEASKKRCCALSNPGDGGCRSSKQEPPPGLHWSKLRAFRFFLYSSEKWTGKNSILFLEMQLSLRPSRSDATSLLNIVSKSSRVCFQGFHLNVPAASSSPSTSSGPGCPLEMLKILVWVHRLPEPLHVLHSPSTSSPGTSPQSSKWPTCIRYPGPWNLPLLHSVHRLKMRTPMQPDDVSSPSACPSVGRVPSASPSVEIEPRQRPNSIISFVEKPLRSQIRSKVSV
mmetsp:Transcript_33004/g.81027  ORF Transcript_33004/g.81027 Transcript_33004/m.81027 type:complete len:239 (-) Transcript_33004:134-850(-)